MMTGYQISRHAWWILAVRGVAAILFGLAALIWPHLTLLVLIYLFGAYALVDGLVAVAVAVQERNVVGHWWILLIEGLAGILAGLVAFFWPGITALVLLALIAAWAILTGVIEIGAAVSFRRALGLEWTLIVGGIVSILLGIVLALSPAAGLLALVWLIGLYAIVFGVLLLIRAWQFHAALSSW
ncbi:HdeD family acid-resistance protein [Thermogemmatispora sp.]|uniref:HdeD family acid-resistance protein n=1 Tax=Thermogemmatispora sp. TaxID=1968838 RepID=UPI001DA04CFB|nr:HdeD family acid-resistance protein [Thermogemmatispora sp.]MBX5450570.1 HdeD family acid-resistance protein [Thermogemmatispora sp.]